MAYLTSEQIAKVDEKLGTVWKEHPKVFLIKSRSSFLEKVEEVVALVEECLKESKN